ncbi:MAG: phosphatase PAP2 family protein [Flavihumibacter sp.]|nr:phosphatase PAP2 family protein [Flavihumibacter sp.]
MHFLHKKIYLSLFLIVIVFTCWAQTVADSLPAQTDSPYYKLNKAYIVGGFDALKYTAAKPLHFTRKDYTRLAIIAGSTAFLMAGDYEIKQFVQRNRQPFTNEVATIIEPTGTYYPMFLMAGMYVTSKLTKNKKLEHASLAAGKSFAVSMLFNVSTKALVRRQRPAYTNNSFSYKAPFTGGRQFTSFPSGHTSAAFSVATALALEYKHTKWVPIVSYTLAGLTGLSRIYQNRHWASDVLVGAAMSHFITKGIYYFEQRKRQQQKIKSVPL